MNIPSIFRQFSKQRIIVIGDVMLDRYIMGTVKRISPEAPVPVLKVSGENALPGGAANVARNLKSLGASVEIFGAVGNDSEGQELLKLLGDAGIGAQGIFLDSKPTTTKTRLIAESQQITRIDKEESVPISEKVRKSIVELFSKSINEDPPNGLIISDYGKGLITEELCREIIDTARRNGIFVAVDPKGENFSKYKGANAITPNQKEAEYVCGFSIKDEKTLKKAAQLLIKQINGDGVLITRGKQGISFLQKGGEVKTIASDAREVFDVTGAGDTVISVFTLFYLSSNSWEAAVRIANSAAGIVVGRVGTATVTQSDLLENLEKDAYTSTRKTLPTELLSVKISHLRANGKKVVFTNGCFDLFHIGHLKLLKEARSLGDALVVGINSDASVKRLKGEERPFIGETDRVNLISALECVDYVIIFGEDTPLELIKKIKPDVIVKGGDYTPEGVVGKEFVENYGGKVSIIPLFEGVSTSSLIDKIRKRK